MREKIQTVLKQLNQGLVERDAALKAALLTMLAGENLLLIGPPGTGKSLIARRISECLSDPDGREDYFEYLLTKFSTPEEIFGPLSITELKADRFKRNIAGYLPTVKIAFLDEIFKASSSILNALLTILNEHIYHNGTERLKVPLQSLIAASNELPTDQAELGALYDRFLVRVFVNYVSENGFAKLFENNDAPVIDRITAAELAKIRALADAITLPTDVMSAIQQIWLQHKEVFKEDRREQLSDRRLKKIIHLLRVSAATNGRREVDLSDIVLLKDCLWNHQDNALKVRELIMKVLQGFSRPISQSEALGTVPESDNPALVYEPGEDGKTLVPVATGSAGPRAYKTGELNAKIRGLKGMGTKEDPFLIENIHELTCLERSDVGAQGYYFWQTADIDCSNITPWLEIKFKGHYHGNGHTITAPKDCGQPFVFDSALDSSFLNINGSGFGLTSSATKCMITACKMTGSLIGNSTNSTITACRSEWTLISNDASRTIIKSCISNGPIVNRTADNCTISDCICRTGDQFPRPVIAKSIENRTIVERCFIFTPPQRSRTRVERPASSRAFATSCENSIIRQCALGDTNDSTVFSAPPGDHTQNCISTDSNQVRPSSGFKRIAAAIFKQHYFEHTLEWDFQKTWFWDKEMDQPALLAMKPDSMKDLQNMEDILVRQIRANIWL